MIMFFTPQREPWAPHVPPHLPRGCHTVRPRGVLWVIEVQSVDIVKAKRFLTQLSINHLGQKSLQPLDFGVQLPGGDGSSDRAMGRGFLRSWAMSQVPLSPVWAPWSPVLAPPAAGSASLPGRARRCRGRRAAPALHTPRLKGKKKKRKKEKGFRPPCSWVVSSLLWLSQNLQLFPSSLKPAAASGWMGTHRAGTTNSPHTTRTATFHPRNLLLLYVSGSI